MEAPEPSILLLTCIRPYRDETVMEPKDDLHLGERKERRGDPVFFA